MIYAAGLRKEDIPPGSLLVCLRKPPGDSPTGLQDPVVVLSGGRWEDYREADGGLREQGGDSRLGDGARSDIAPLATVASASLTIRAEMVPATLQPKAYGGKCEFPINGSIISID